MSIRLQQAALILAGGGAILILVAILGTAANLIGLAAILVGTALTARFGRTPGHGWWSLLAAGALLSVLGALLSLATEAVGGLIALIGGVAVLVGAAFGFPTGPGQDR